MLRKVRIGIDASGASIATPQPYVCSRPTTSSTFGNCGSSSALIRETANSTTPATHCTVVVIARMLRVPTVPSAFRKPSKLKPSSGACGSRCTVAIGKPSSERASGMRSSRSWTQLPAAIGFSAKPIAMP